MRNTKQAFTLVELIVVITILAILGTIAFISLQGYSADARNSTRTTNLNTMVSKINLQLTSGSPIMSFASNDDSNVTTPNLGGTLAIGAEYQAWVPNYTALGIKGEDYQDPQADQPFPIGVTSFKWGQFEVASMIEDSASSPITQVIGTFQSRGAGTGTLTWSGTLGLNSLITLNDQSINKFFRNDVITIGTSTGTVLKVSDDLQTLTVSGDLTTEWVTDVTLSIDEISGLIGSAADLSTPVVQDWSDLPY